MSCITHVGCDALPSAAHWLAGRRSPHEVPDAPSQPRDPPATHARWTAPTGAIPFDIVRVDLPVDTIRHARKVWNHVDELRLDAASIGLLVRNGLRVGAASQDAWAAWRAIFAACDAHIGDVRSVVQAQPPLTIRLGALEQPQSYCWYARGGRLIGKTFPDGERLVHIGYVAHPELGGQIDMTVRFEVRQDLGVMTWERRGGAFVQVPAYERHMFDDLSATVALKPGEFLVIGPSEEADNAFLVGSRLFTGTRQGRSVESLLLVTPRPVGPQGAARWTP